MTYLALHDVQATQAWIHDYLHAQHGVQPHQARNDATFGDLGLTSADLLQLVGTLADESGCDLEETLPFEYSTVTALAGALAALHC